jgi:hypothetical protein
MYCVDLVMAILRRESSEESTEDPTKESRLRQGTKKGIGKPREKEGENERERRKGDARSGLESASADMAIWHLGRALLRRCPCVFFSSGRRFVAWTRVGHTYLGAISGW